MGFRDMKEQATFHAGREYERKIQAERIAELEADICPSRMGKEKGCNEAQDVVELHEQIKELETEIENLKTLMLQLIFIAEKSTTDDSEDTTIELANQALEGK